jgi:Fe-S cluster assembly ATP-binding protein
MARLLSSMSLLEVRGLYFSVPARPILAGVDIAIEQGEIHALVGANGSGKSTLAYLVMGCEGYRPGAGNIDFDGQRIEALPIYQRARLGITLAWQEPARFEGLSVQHYLAVGPRKRVDGAGCLRAVGLSPADYVGRMVDKTLSGGERKRIEIASVLALSPRLVILDEPTAGIDILSIREIIDVINRFKHRGAAVLLITHRDEVVRIADRASLLNEGRIACTGSPGMVAGHYLASSTGKTMEERCNE